MFAMALMLFAYKATPAASEEGGGGGCYYCTWCSGGEVCCAPTWPGYGGWSNCTPHAGDHCDVSGDCTRAAD